MRKLMYEIRDCEDINYKLDFSTYGEAQDFLRRMKSCGYKSLKAFPKMVDYIPERLKLSPARQAMLNQFGYAAPKLRERVVL